MNNVREFYNEICLGCNSCEEVMVKIGPMPFCEHCLIALFVCDGAYTDVHVDEESVVYKTWLKKYKQRIVDKANQEAEDG